MVQRNPPAVGVIRQHGVESEACPGVAPVCTFCDETVLTAVPRQWVNSPPPGISDPVIPRIVCDQVANVQCAVSELGLVGEGRILQEAAAQMIVPFSNSASWHSSGPKVLMFCNEPWGSTARNVKLSPLSELQMGLTRLVTGSVRWAQNRTLPGW